MIQLTLTQLSPKSKISFALMESGLQLGQSLPGTFAKQLLIFFNSGFTNKYYFPNVSQNNLVNCFTYNFAQRADFYVKFLIYFLLFWTLMSME